MQDSSKSYQELLEENAVLKQQIKKLQESVPGNVQSTEVLRGTSKELDNIYLISDSIKKTDILEDLLQKIVNQLPRGLLYPEHTCARITFQDQEFKTKNYRKTAWMLSAGIMVNRNPVGLVEICYLEKMPDRDEGPFLNEERRFINTVADLIERLAAHRQAERAVRESEEKYRILVENATDMIYRTDALGHFTFINPAALRMTGYTEKDVTGKPYSMFIHPDYKTEAERFYGLQFVKKIPLTYWECPLFTIDKSEIWIGQHVQLIIEDGQVAGFHAIARDVTARRKAEETLRENEEKYRSVVEKSLIGIAIIDKASQFTYVNDVLCTMAGYDKQEILGKNFTYLLAEESKALMADRNRRRQLGEDVPSEYEFYFVKKSGEKRTGEIRSALYFDSAGKTKVIIQVIDVTERKQMEEMLRQSEEKFMNVFMMAPDCIAITRLFDGQIIDVNHGFEEIMGWTRGEVIGRTSFDINFWVDSSDRDFMVRELSAGRDIRMHEFQFRRKDGSLRYGVYSTRSIRIAGESCLIFILQDATERRRLAEERLKMQEHLNRAAKMEAIGTLSGGIAHDFNNILSAMMGFAELIQYKTTDLTIAPYLEQILKACDRSRDLIKQILTFSRQREHEKQPVSVTPIVKEAMKLLRSSIPSTIEIRQRYNARQDTVLADPTQIHQVLMNLCTNAVHAMQERKGVLEVTLNQRELSSYARIYHPELREGAYLQLTVIDTGKGIDPSIKDRIFDPFFTTKELGEGTGLGLSVVYGIVQDCGGFISVDSEPGKGTIFTIYLPLFISDQVPSVKQTSSIPKGKGHILLVDDEKPIAALGYDVLTTLGYDVTVCYGSLDALAAFRSNPQRFDLVVTDMTMPHMTGAIMARELLKIRPEIPIILVTGYSEIINEEEARKIGIREFIMKPVSFESYAQAVKRNIVAEQIS